MDRQDFNNLATIANRYADLYRRLIGDDAPAVHEIIAAVYVSHTIREPLRLDLLAGADDVDLAHDVGGIMRGDRWQSARYALAYHPRRTEAAHV